jgi:hypothetical protein
MKNTPLSDVTPIFFLQTFILELMHASEQQGQKHCEQLIEHIAKTAGCFFEETYREETHNSELLDKESYTELILGLKITSAVNFHWSPATPIALPLPTAAAHLATGSPISPNCAE